MFGEDLFYLEITSFFGPNCSIFSIYFGLHKTGIPSYLSSPRAHFWSPAPLLLRIREIVGKGLGYLFIISSSSHFFNKTDFEQYMSLNFGQKMFTFRKKTLETSKFGNFPLPLQLQIFLGYL